MLDTMILLILKLLTDFGVKKINIRARFSGKPLSLIVPLDGNENEKISKFIEDNKLEKETVYTTFNEPRELLNQNKAFSDASIINRRFILLDFDSIREAGISSTNLEKEATIKVTKNVMNYLTEKGFVNLIRADSGNGMHILIPLESGVDAGKSTKKIKQFLHVLANKFNTDEVEIDTTVFNPSRLTKLYGTVANKGEDTDKRPHRCSRLLTTEWSTKVNSFDLVKQVITELSEALSENIQTCTPRVIQSSKTKGTKFVYANAENWLDNYDLSYRKKKGDVEGMTLFILDKCPLKTHSNNENGASLQQTSDGKVMFTCLHDSHKELTIYDFKEMYPLPNMEKVKLSINYLKKGFIKVYSEYKITDKGVYRYIKEDYVKLFDPMFISDQKRVIESNEIEMKLIYFSDGEWLSRWIKGSDLSVGEFKKLSKFAVPIYPRAEQDIITFLLKQKSDIPVNDMHKQIGWGSTNQFLLSENFGNTTKKSVFEESRLLKLTSKGNYTEWLNMVKKYILGNSGSELGLALGFSSIIVGYLARMNDHPKSLICELLGVSSTGKSTIQQFVVSIYSSRGLFDSFNATENSIIEKLNGNFGLAYCLDEWNSNTLHNPTRFIYQLSSGMSRMKLDSNSNIRDQAEFSTTILTSSETSIRNTAEDLAGLDVRVLPFRDVSWTRDAEAADAIKRLSNENSGVAAVEFMTRLFKKNHDELILEAYELAKITLDKSFSNHKFKSRLLDQYSMVLSAVYLLELVMEIKLDEEGIITQLKESYSLITENIVENKLDYTDVLIKVFNRNKNALKAGDAMYDKQLAMKGRYITTNDVIKVQYFNSDFKKDLLYELDEKTSDEAIAEIYKKGLLNHEKGRRTKRVRIDGIQYTVYEFEVERSEEANEDSTKMVSNILVVPPLKDDVDEL